MGITPGGRPSSRRAQILEKIKRALSAATISNPETAPLATGVTVTTGTADDATLSRQISAKALFTLGLMAAVGGQFYYSNTSERGVITSNNVAGDLNQSNGDAGNLGNTLPNPVPVPPVGTNAFGPSFYKIGTDAAKLQVRMAAATANLPIRVRVNGRYVDRVGYDVSGANTWLNIDLGSRKARTIEIETQGLCILFYIRIDPLSRLWNPTPADALTVIQYGDSHTEGAGNGSAPAIARWATCSRIFADLIGAWDFRIASVRSSGFVHRGSSGLLATIGETMDVSIAAKPCDIVGIAGGFNDNGKSWAEIRVAVLAALRKARAAQPNALIVVWGIWGAATGPSAGIAGLEGWMKATFDLWGDPFSVFIPVSTASEPWEFGTGKSTAPNGSGNSDLYVGPDGVHATGPGHEYRAYRQDLAVRQAVAALPIPR